MIIGKVISTKMQDTVVVAVTRQVAHPRYHKRIQHTTKYHAHATVPLAVGDTVKIVQIRPVSKTVQFKVLAKIT